MKNILLILCLVVATCARAEWVSPPSATAWSDYPATHPLDMAGNAITHADSITTSNLTLNGETLDSFADFKRDVGWQVGWTPSFAVSGGGGTNMTMFRFYAVGGTPYYPRGWNLLLWPGCLATNFPTPVIGPTPAADASRTNLILEYKQYTPAAWGAAPYVWRLACQSIDLATSAVSTSELFTVTNLYTQCGGVYHTNTLGIAYGTGITHSVTSPLFSGKFESLLYVTNGAFLNRPATAPAASFGILWRYKWVK